MGVLKLLHPRFALALLRNIVLKIRFRGALDIDIFRTYFAAGAKVTMSGSGKLRFARTGKRIYISEGCEINVSGGTLEVGEGVFFNRNCTVVAHEYISIGSHCMFGSGVCVFDSDHVFDRVDIPFAQQGYKRSPVSLGGNVWIGANTVITRGSQIASNVVVGANSLVKGELAGCHVYGGVPVKKLRAIGQPLGKEPRLALS